MVDTIEKTRIQFYCIWQIRNLHVLSLRTSQGAGSVTHSVDSRVLVKEEKDGMYDNLCAVCLSVA